MKRAYLIVVLALFGSCNEDEFSVYYRDQIEESFDALTDEGADLQFSNSLDGDGNSIAVTWAAFSGSEITDHRLKTYTDKDCTQNEVDHGLTGSASASASNISSLSNGLYWATVTAYNSQNDSVESSCSSDFIVVNTSASSIPTNGLTLWIDPSINGSLFQDDTCDTAASSNSDPVACALDLSGSGNTARQSTSGSEPVLDTSTLTNNSFYLANDYLVVDNESNFDFTSGFTVFIVFRVNSFTTNFETFISKGDQMFSLKRDSSNNDTNFESHTFPSASYDSIDGTTLVNDSTRRYATLVYDNGVKDFLYNGISEGTSDVSPAAPENNDFNVCIGCDLDSTGRALRDSNIGEVLIYNRALSAGEISTVEAYLSTKW